MIDNRPVDVAAAGHICLDIIPKFPDGAGKTIEEIMRPGKLVNVEAAAISTGGPVSNTGIGLSILGMDVEFITQVGDDYFGEAIISRLQKIGHSEGVRIAKGQHSSYTIAIAPPGIDRIFLHNPGTNNTFTSDSFDIEPVRKARIFHLGYPPLMRGLYANGGEELTKTFKKAKEAGATTSLDMSLPDPASESGRVQWDSILQNTLPYVDIFLPSIEEGMFFTQPDRYLDMRQKNGGKEILDLLNGDDYTELAEKFLEYGSRMVALKSAHRGWYLRTGSKEKLAGIGPAQPGDIDSWANRELWCPAFHVEKIASATGSGDSSIAGFLSAYLRGERIERCLQFANCVGSQNIRQLDALSGIKTWDETVAMVAANLEQNKLDPETPGWEWDASWRMWIRS
ncbi:MAG: carbohydrate kinase family protein [Armatimonadota bacterium]|nr:carbohydrate kinase family protein [Armatimonadota bacterium]